MKIFIEIENGDNENECTTTKNKQKLKNENVSLLKTIIGNRYNTICLPVVAVYQLETLVVEREAFDFVAALLQLETVVDCFVACPYSGFANKYINQEHEKEKEKERERELKRVVDGQFSGMCSAYTIYVWRN